MNSESSPIKGLLQLLMFVYLFSDQCGLNLWSLIFPQYVDFDDIA